MPVVAGAPLVVIGLGFFLILWLYASEVTLKGLSNALAAHIPAIGSALRRGIDAIVNTALSPVRSWIRPHLTALIKWLEGVADIFTDFPGEVRRFARELLRQLDHYAHVVSHDVIKAFVNPVLRRVIVLETAVTAFPRELTNLEKRVFRGIDDLKDWVIAHVLERALHGIDRLRHDVFAEAIPALRDFVMDRVRDLRGEIATVEHGAERIAADLRDLAKRLDVPIELLEALIAAVGVTAAIEALETLGTCRGKLKTLCTSDPRAWEQFIAGLALVAFWPGLEELTRELGGLLDRIAQPTADFIIHGS